MPASAHVDSPHPTIVVGGDGTVLAMNAFAETALGRRSEAAQGQAIETVIGFSIDTILTALNGGNTTTTDAAIPAMAFSGCVARSDGTAFQAEITCTQFRCQAQQFAVLHVFDVSLRHCTLTRLRQLSLALEQTAEHAVITDAAGTILYVNRAFEEVTGFSRASAIGKTMNIVKSGKHDASFYSHLWLTLRSGAIFEGEVINRNAKGDLYIDEQRISPFIDAETGATYYIATGRDVTERRFQDPLTGLPTRTALIERISQAIARCERHSTTNSFALAFIDLDRFRGVNDAHGFLTGDRVLAEIGSRIRQAVRRIDVVAQASHLDRDEFAVLLEELRGPEDARRVAQRLIGAISEPITLDDGSTIVVDASIGIASPTAGHVSAEALLQDAETAMRRAKATPVEPVQVFNLTMHERARARLNVETELRTALARDEFVLHYQPIVSLSTGRVTSCEALIRWIHPTRGFVPPLEFIGIAEDMGLIVPLGRLVLEKACQQARLMHSMGFGDLSMAVNVSARQLSEPRFVETVLAILTSVGLAPRLLKVEITESVAATNSDAATAVLHELRALGVEILIDDFGTGYSSLSRLTRFPSNKLKIDRSFVMNLPDSGHDSAVAATIVAMAHSLGLGVIAEGVETIDQAMLLRSIGCEEMQGYLFSKPVDGATLGRMLQEGKRLVFGDGVA